MRISVVICTFNRSCRLADALTSLLAQQNINRIDCEIIVVDNNSTDGTDAVVGQFMPRFNNRLRYYFEPTQGLSVARNSGIRIATGEIIAFIDDDVIVDEQWLNNIGKYFKNNADLVAIAGRVLPKFFGERPSWLKFDQQHILRGPLNYYDHGDKAFLLKGEGGQFIGTNMIFHKRVFERNGLFACELKKINGRYLLTEDSEFFLRLSRRGEAIMYAPDVMLEHVCDEKRLTKAYFRKWYYYAGIANRMLELQISGSPRWSWWLIREFIEYYFSCVCFRMRGKDAESFYYSARLSFDLGRARATFFPRSYLKDIADEGVSR